jgi:hypothetical protein
MFADMQLFAVQAHCGSGMQEGVVLRRHSPCSSFPLMTPSRSRLWVLVSRQQRSSRLPFELRPRAANQTICCRMPECRFAPPRSINEAPPPKASAHQGCDRRSARLTSISRTKTAAKLLASDEARRRATRCRTSHERNNIALKFNG